jgi:prevent-host-death family protein
MKQVPVSKAGSMLRQLFAGVVETRQAVRLTSHNASAVLVSWEAWREIEETIHRLSSPRFEGASR